jgi:hypothetical protein
MPASHHTSNTATSRPKRRSRHAFDSGIDCQTDLGRCEGFFGSAKSNRDLSRCGRRTEGSIWRDSILIRMGKAEHTLHARHIQGRVVTYRTAHARTASRRLRRHDDSSWRDADGYRTSGEARVGRIPEKQTALLQPHLSGGQPRRTVDRIGRDHGTAVGLGTTSDLETYLRHRARGY